MKINRLMKSNNTGNYKLRRVGKFGLLLLVGTFLLGMIIGLVLHSKGVNMITKKACPVVKCLKIVAHFVISLKRL